MYTHLACVFGLHDLEQVHSRLAFHAASAHIGMHAISDRCKSLAAGARTMHLLQTRRLHHGPTNSPRTIQPLLVNHRTRTVAATMQQQCTTRQVAHSRAEQRRRAVMSGRAALGVPCRWRRTCETNTCRRALALCGHGSRPHGAPPFQACSSSGSPARTRLSSVDSEERQALSTLTAACLCCTRGVRAHSPGRAPPAQCIIQSLRSRQFPPCQHRSRSCAMSRRLSMGARTTAKRARRGSQQRSRTHGRAFSRRTSTDPLSRVSSRVSSGVRH